MEREWPVSFKALLDGFDATILMSMATIELLAKAKGAALEQHFDALFAMIFLGAIDQLSEPCSDAVLYRFILSSRAASPEYKLLRNSNF